MSETKRFRFMNVAICCCLLFTALMVIACYVGRWFGVDTTHELTITATVFGGELVLTMVRTITKKKDDGKKGVDG